jgi:hypothetical protein
MKFEIHKIPKKKDQRVTQVMFRLSHKIDLVEAFNKALDESGGSAQQLVEDMVSHCLKDLNLL